MCLTTAVEDSSITEKQSDITGNSVDTEVKLSLVYRVPSATNSGIGNLSYIATLEKVFDFLRSNARSIEISGGKIERVKLNSGAKLDMVYQGGIKDFKITFTIGYFREI